MKLIKSVFVLATLGILICGCQSRKGKSEIEIVFTPDTLNVGYTYWWSESGPFIGNCGEELSLVFTGVIKQIDPITDQAGPLYNSQNGIVEIDEVFKIKEIENNTYTTQNFFKSDCFSGSDLQIGDRVLVTCYDYEDNYSIPGGKSILKIESLDDPLITSIRKYIDGDENPVKLKKDIGLWATQSLGRGLERIIECKNEMEKNSDTSEIEGNE